MEALGAAASVAGLISLAIEIPKVVDIAISIRLAPEEAAKLSKTANALVLTLQKLEAFLKTNEAREMQIADDSAMMLAISHCQTQILNLSKKLRSVTVVPSEPPKRPISEKIKATMTRIRWPLEKQECLDRISEIHAMQSTFEFCLIIANCRQMSKSHTEAIAHLKSQSDMLTQMAASFPNLTVNANQSLEMLGFIENCVVLASQKVDRIQVGLEELQTMRKDLAEYHLDNLYGQALEWLSPIDPSMRHEAIRCARLCGTCEWACVEPAFQQFVQCPPDNHYSGVLCWVGDPGQGKTYTMSRIVDYLSGHTQPDSGSHVTYLYCDYQRTKSYSATALVGALVRQLLTNFDTLPGQVNDLVRHACFKLRRSSAKMDEIHQILDILKQHVTRLFICIDALDECNDAESLVAACKRFPMKTSFLFIGRQTITRTIKKAFPAAMDQMMEANRRDINAVISAQVKDEQKKDSALMPDWLSVEIFNEISKLANGMFLLASLHTTLVLSHNTVHRRREALRNLPHTLDSTFGQTLERIRAHIHYTQAFRLLAWIHTIGPLSLHELQHVLAVESHHARFEKDNLPNRTSLLDCCLGLVRLDAPQNINPHSIVTLVHSTLSTYFDTQPAIFGSAISDIAGACLTYLSFDPLKRPNLIHALIEDSWVQFLHKANDLSSELQEAAWQYCIAVNDQINEETVPFTALPRQAQELASHKSLIQLESLRPSEQSIVHTACMLGLDRVDPFLKTRLFEAVPQSSKEVINGVDKFGMNPLGWILLSRNHFDKHKSLQTRPSSFDSLEHNLWRAERLIENFSGLNLNESLWDIAALEHIRAAGTTSVIGNRIEYFSAYPLLFFLGNYSSAPGAVRRCLSLLSSHLELNIWTTLIKDSTSDARLNTENKRSDKSWNLLIIASEDMSRRGHKKFEPDIFQTFAIYPNAQQTKTEKNPASPNWEWKEVAALFEPNKDVPALVTAYWETERLDWYLHSRQDITRRMTDPFPGTSCRCYILPEQTLLHVGAASDNIEITKLALFTCRLDPNLRDHAGRTALHQALRYPSVNTALYLIDNTNIDPTITDSSGMSALHICAQRQLTKVASIILARFAVNVNLQDHQGKTVLHYAAEQRSSRMVNLLLDNKADVNIEDGNGATPLHLAITKRDAIICAIILNSYPQVTFSSSNLQSAWNLTVEAGGSFLMMLVRALHSQPRGLLPAPSHELPSAMIQNVNILQHVLTTDKRYFKDEDLDFMLKLSRSTELSGDRPLMLGTSNSLVDLPKSETTIREAIVKGAENIAVYLLRHSPLEVNRLGEDGESVLHLAVVYDAPQLARFVLDHTDINVTLLDPQGYTALQLSIIHTRLHVLQVLLESPRVPASDIHTGSGATVLTMAITHRFLDAIPLLLQRDDVCVNHLDASGRTALHRAVTQQNVAIIKLLLDCPRVSVATPSRDGRTALGYAALCASSEIVSLLMRTGAFDLGHRDSYGNTALDWARRNTCKEVQTILQNAEQDVARSSQ